ncbi:hypothetical protein D3C86_1358850 [compost metagenome]
MPCVRIVIRLIARKINEEFFFQISIVLTIRRTMVPRPMSGRIVVGSMQSLRKETPCGMHSALGMVRRKNIHHGCFGQIVIEAIAPIRTGDVVAATVFQDTGDTLKMPDQIRLMFNAMAAEDGSKFPVNHVESAFRRDIVNLWNP